MVTTTKARLADVPALAWTSALAFTRNDNVDRPARAVLEYSLQLAATLGLLSGGRLFHENRVVMVGLVDPRKSQLLPGLAGAVVYVIPIALISVVLPVVTGSMVATVAGLLLLFGSLAPALKRMLRPEIREAERALQESVDALPKDRQVCTFSLLARRLDAAPGSGQRVLRRVLDENVPPKTLVACIAADRRLVPMYKELGLRQLKGSLAMLGPEKNQAGLM